MELPSGTYDASAQSTPFAGRRGYSGYEHEPQVANPNFSGACPSAQAPPATFTNLAYQPGASSCEIVRGSCNQVIKSRPQDGFVVCEHCGGAGRTL